MENVATDKNEDEVIVGGRGRACDSPGLFSQLFSLLSILQIAGSAFAHWKTFTEIAVSTKF